jgi:carbon storage regulator
MLVISRKVGETIRIGNDVIIRLTRVAGGRVSMGIEAPLQVRILRGELEWFPEDEDVNSRLPEVASIPPSFEPPTIAQT